MDSLSQISKRIDDFEIARGWNTTPSADLAKSIIIEAAELLEHYQFDSDSIENDKKDKEEIAFEAADVFIYLVVFCLRNNIDLIEAANKKIDKQEKKYPAEMFNGKHNNEFYKAQKAKYRKEKQ